MRAIRTAGFASLGAAIAIALSACGGSEPLDISAADNGGTIGIEPGQTIEITLESNRTTGFQWNLVSEPDPAVLTLASSQYVEPEDGLVGQGGVEVWEFEGQEPGSTTLELSYFRPFESEAVADEFTLTVEVG